MGPVEITSIVGVVVTVLTSLVVPWWLRRRQHKQNIDQTGLQSWQSVTHVLQGERDDLKRQIVTMQKDFEQQIRTLKQEYGQQLTDAKNRITELEAEVTELYARLGRNSGSGGFLKP